MGAASGILSLAAPSRPKGDQGKPESTRPGTPRDGLKHRPLLWQVYVPASLRYSVQNPLSRKNKIKSIIGKPVRAPKCSHFSESNKAGGKRIPQGEQTRFCVGPSWWQLDADSGTKSSVFKSIPSGTTPDPPFRKKIRNTCRGEGAGALALGRSTEGQNCCQRRGWGGAGVWGHP